MLGEEVAAGATKVRQRLEVAKRAGNFLPQLQHPQSPLGLVVIEGNGKIVYENEKVMRVI